MKNIQDFHKKHNYIVTITSLERTPGCYVTYPSNLLLKMPFTERTYILSYDPCVIELFIKEGGDDIISRRIEADAGNIRLLVMQDVFLQANKRNMSKDLIINNESKNLFELLELPEQTPEEKERETQLYIKFRKLLDGDVTMSEIEGYDQLLSYFESGGL